MRADLDYAGNHLHAESVYKHLEKYTDWYNLRPDRATMSKSDDTRTFIIERTAELFNRKGFAGTSLSDITDATQLTKGSIYGNFANKDEVALAAFDHNLKQVNAVLDQELSKHTTAKGKLLAYGNIYANFTDYPFPGGGCPVLNTATEADDTHPALKKKARAALNGWKKKIESVVAMGIENGEFRKGTDPEQVALTIIALIEGTMLIAETLGKQAYRKTIMQSLDQFIRQLK